MGLNICVCNRRYQEHPDWDWGRMGGDKEFVEFSTTLPRIEQNWGSLPDYEWYWRPADFKRWREALAAREWPSPGRFEHLVDLLERDTQYWVHFSW